MVETIRLIEAWVMPPGSILLLLLFALFLTRWLRKFPLFLIWVATIALYLLSTPWLKFELAEQLETTPALIDIPVIDENEQAAIVILGGGRYTAAPEFGRDVVGRATLERIRYGSYLHKKSGFPILVADGEPLNEGVPESQLMADSLWSDFAISGVLQEKRSINTWEHSRFVPPILKQHKISTMLLVTHASHMQRSLRVFKYSPEMEGITIVPAPTAFTVRSKMDRGLGLWRPSARALTSNVSFLHEWLGLLWYRIKYIT
ncbi:MAG: YdcF family protein [Thiotrichales bacterium]|nr:YdcF family protein [Thiotrichales bacterium]MBT3837617.1 YdcF family protein [Thiotrichales bacterium]MBT7870052.1 YdcF family protein [Thiotrichales bacterium]